MVPELACLLALHAGVGRQSACNRDSGCLGSADAAIASVRSQAKHLTSSASQSQHRVLFLSWPIFTSLRGRNVCLCASVGTSKRGFASG